MEPSKKNNQAGKDVVFIHGMWSNNQVAEPMRKYFEHSGVRFHSPNLPRHGEPFDHSQAQLSSRDYVNAIKQFIENKKFSNPPSLVGHSMGGLIAQIVASEIEVDALVLLNSTGPAGVNHIYLDQLRCIFPFLGTVNFWNKVHLPDFEFARRRIFNLFSDQEAREIYDALVYESGRCVGEVAFWFGDPQRATRINGEVSGRKILVVGGQDRLVSPNVSKKLAKRYPDAELRIYPNHGHWLFGEPGDDAIYRDIVNWVKDSSKPPKTKAPEFARRDQITSNWMELFSTNKRTLAPDSMPNA